MVWCLVKRRDTFTFTFTDANRHGPCVFSVTLNLKGNNFIFQILNLVPLECVNENLFHPF